MIRKHCFIVLSFIAITFMSFVKSHDSFENYSENLQGLVEELHLPTGRHVIADLENCQHCYYTNEIENVLRQAAQQASATVLAINVIPFPAVLVDGKMVQGMTGVVILSESHIAFHTWPENGFVACDIFTCGTSALPEEALQVLCDHFQPKTSNVRVLSRGLAAKLENNFE